MKKYKLNLFIILALWIVGLVGPAEAAGQPPTGLLIPDQVVMENLDQQSTAESFCDLDILTEPDFQNKSVEYIYFVFSDPIDLNLFKFYLKETSQVILGLDYLTEGGFWSSIPEVNLINCSYLNQGWNRYPLNMVTQTNQLRLRIEGMEDGGSAIGEVEFWGRSAGAVPIQTVEYLMEENTILEFSRGKGPQKPKKGPKDSDKDTLSKSVHVNIGLPIRYLQKAELIYDVYDLEKDMEGFWQINGREDHSLTPPSKSKTWVTAIEEIDPTLLVIGENEISFKMGKHKKNGFKIANVRLRLSYAGEGQIERVEDVGIHDQLLSNLIDDNPVTYWETDWYLYDQISFKLYLAEELDLEYITWLQDARFVDSVRIEYLAAGEWRLFTEDLEEEELLDGWNAAKVAGAVQTDQIRFTIMNPRNKQMIGPIKEIKVWGSKVKSRSLEPEILISYPRTGDVVKENTLVKGFVRGDCDSIRINGKKISVTNNYFEVRVKLHKPKGRKTYTRTITVEAHKNGRIVGESQVEVFLKPAPTVEIQSPVDGYLTEADQVLIEGETDSKSNNLYLNDQWFSKNSTYYQVNHYLQEGINPVTIKAVNNKDLSHSETIYIRRDQQVPKIYFAEDYNNRVLGEVLNYFSIKGYVEDYSRCKLYVNDQEFLLESENFSYPAYLQAGYNNFTFRFVDELGHESSESIRLIQDSTPPNPFTPTADPAEWNQITQPVIHFSTTDDQVGIDHYELSIDEKEYFVVESPYTLPVLEDGIHTIYVKAVDKVDLETVGTPIKVYVDTTPPEQFEVIANPDQWNQVTQPVISFGTEDKQSGVSHYELSLDGGEYMTAVSPYTLPKLNDGVHTISVRAVDHVGLMTSDVVEVYVDTTPPVEFTPIADPADWDRVNQPTISFVTTDKDSGVSHFELQIDDGEFVTVESPYQVPVLEDGIHDITIRAIDHVGLETIGTVQVFVDTTPPAVPAAFKVFSGDGEVLVKWNANMEEDLVEYRLHREPAWEDTEVKSIDPVIEPEFLDVSVVNGNEYTYYLEAVDHVENISDPTAALTEKVGISRVEIIPEEGGEIQYGDDVAINIPAQAIEEDGTIQIVTAEESEVPEVVRPKVSKVYKLDVVDAQGQVKEEPQFDKEISISLGYDESLIPEGYSEYDLDIYYYNELDGLWVIMPKAEIDIFENKIRVNSNHFSMYSVQVTENYSPAAESYNDLGIAPYNSYFKNNQEFVSPGSASLNINTVDVSLPGRNGFNLSLGRIYNSNQGLWDGLDVGNPVYASFGDGWRINLARIVNNSHGEYVYLEDGTAIKIDWNKGEESDGRRANYFEYHKGHHFIIYKEQQKNLLVFWKNVDYEIYFKDGRKYEFDKHGRLTRMIDPTENNIITFSYSDEKEENSKLSEIVDSVGRKVTFSYSGNYITGIYVNGDKFATYGYTDGVLSSVADRMNRITSYEYMASQVKLGGTYSAKMRIDFEDPNLQDSVEDISGGSVKEYTVYSLEKIKYPTQGISTYKYNLVKKSDSDTLHDSGEGTYEGYKYTYSMSGSSKSYSVKRLVLLDSIKYLSANEVEEIDPIDYDFTYDDDNQVTKAVINQLYQRVEMEFDDEGLNTVKRFYDLVGDAGSLEVEAIREEYAYNQQNAITEKSVYHNGKESASYYEQFSYDTWGNVIYSYNSESGAKFYYYYLNSSSTKPTDSRFIIFDESQTNVKANIHNLLADQYVINFDPVNKKYIPQQIHFHYDSDGNKIAEAKRHENKWIKIRYVYDNYGNVVKEINPLGNITDIFYDTNHLYPVKVVKDAGLDAEGNLQPRLITQYGYNQVLGVKEWEIDSNAGLVEFIYDQLGRLTGAIFPDENDTYSGTIGSLSPANYSNRQDNLVKLQIYDDKNNETIVSNVIFGSMMIESVVTVVNDVKATIPESVNPKILNIARYKYDGMNRWIELKQYLRSSELQTIDGQKQISPFTTTFGYDQVGNQTKVIDAEGYVTFKKYDGLGRITDIYYADENKYKINYDNNNKHLNIAYDKAKNSRAITDASGRVTEEIKDWNDNVIEVAQYNNGMRHYSHATYDNLGNQIAIVDGKEQTFIFVYDDLNRLIEKIMPEMDTILPLTNTVISYSPTYKYEYDDLGQKIAEITPNGVSTTEVGDFRTDYVYDAVGRVTQVIGNKNGKNIVTKNYYDSLGNLVKAIDAEGHEMKKVYHPRGWILAEVDPMKRIVYHQFNELGNEIAVTDPRGVVKVNEANFEGLNIEIFGENYRLNPAYTTKTEYDSMGRNTKTTDMMGNTHEIRYDRVGNKQVEIVSPRSEDFDLEQRITHYTYTPQYWVKSIVQGSGNLSHKIEYVYDAVGNVKLEIYPDVKGMASRTNVYEYDYDGFNRVIKVTRPDGSYERYEYDAIGNKTAVINGRGNSIRYDYNGLNRLTEVLEPTGFSTYYYYDPNGNMVRKVLANGLTTDYKYSVLDLLEEEVKYRAGDLMRRKFFYDNLANVKTRIDARDNVTAFSYYDDGQIKEETYYRPASEIYQIPDLNLVTTETVPNGYELEEKVIYLYDGLGNLKQVTDGLGSMVYDYDKLNYIIRETRSIDGKSYMTEYDYDFVGNLKKIKYPNSNDWINYKYNKLNQLTNISHVADQLNQNFKYDPAGNLVEMVYKNKITTSILPDAIGRPQQITVKNSAGNELLNLNYAYDANGNVITRNQNSYTYDELDRLETAEIDGTILVDRPAIKGYVDEDYFINRDLDYEIQDLFVDFDYAASTIGLKFDTLQNIGRIEMIPDEIGDYRFKQSSIRIFYRKATGEDFTEIPKSDWVFDLDSTGKVILTFKSTIVVSEIKVHSNFDDRNVATRQSVNKSEFCNVLKDMVKVYGRYDKTKISYEYDQVGNRISETYSDPNSDYSVVYSYNYYSNSNRLKSRESQFTENMLISPNRYIDGLLRIGTNDKNGYQYDRAGNQIAKGNSYNLSGDSINYSSSGEGVTYWKYAYNTKNRLTAVFKNGGKDSDQIASYGYDYVGKRLKVEQGDRVTYYVYNHSGQLLYEENSEQSISYIYAFGKVIAKIEEMIALDEELNKEVKTKDYYYYHHDNLGSTAAITDGTGSLAFEQDYAPFGQNIFKSGTYDKTAWDIEPGVKFTGQKEDIDTGLYYYNSRYYDPEIGRFIREDEYQGKIQDVQSLNLYVYVANNPLKYIDPSGNIYLYLGSEGDQVRTAQRMLGLPETGAFDEFMLDAVNKFKEMYGLGNTGVWQGVIGDHTWHTMQGSDGALSAEQFAQIRGVEVNTDDQIYFDLEENSSIFRIQAKVSNGGFFNFGRSDVEYTAKIVKNEVIFTDIRTKREYKGYSFQMYDYSNGDQKLMVSSLVFTDDPSKIWVHIDELSGWEANVINGTFDQYASDSWGIIADNAIGTGTELKIAPLAGLGFLMYGPMVLNSLCGKDFLMDPHGYLKVNKGDIEIDVTTLRHSDYTYPYTMKHYFMPDFSEIGNELVSDHMYYMPN